MRDGKKRNRVLALLLNTHRQQRRHTHTRVFAVGLIKVASLCPSFMFYKAHHSSSFFFHTHTLLPNSWIERYMYVEEGYMLLFSMFSINHTIFILHIESNRPLYFWPSSFFERGKLSFWQVSKSVVKKQPWCSKRHTLLLLLCELIFYVTVFLVQALYLQHEFYESQPLWSILRQPTTKTLKLLAALFVYPFPN